MTTPHILMIVTSHAKIGDTDEPTGVWFEELATPYYAFQDAGAVVHIASIAGGAVPIDPRSTASGAKIPESVKRFQADATAQAAAETPMLSADAWQSYDAIFLPGGHGTMWDLPDSAELATLVTDAFAAGRIVSAVCHGPAGLVNAKAPDGRPLAAGRKVSAFTDQEEAAVGLTKVVPFLLETRLRELGALFEGGPAFQPYAVADGRLVTGQNPASSAAVAERVVAQLRQGS